MTAAEVVAGVGVGPTRPGFRDGVAVVVVRRDASWRALILVGLRRGAHGAGTWSVPGGKPEPGDTLAEAGARELAEETGLAGSLARYLGDCYDTFEGQSWRTHYLLFEAPGEPYVREPHKCERWEWHSPDSLPAPLFAPLATFLAAGGFAGL